VVTGRSEGLVMGLLSSHLKMKSKRSQVALSVASTSTSPKACFLFKMPQVSFVHVEMHFHYAHKAVLNCIILRISPKADEWTKRRIEINFLPSEGLGFHCFSWHATGCHSLTYCAPLPLTNLYIFLKLDEKCKQHGKSSLICSLKLIMPSSTPIFT
jgi:hypothetical protein